MPAQTYVYISVNDRRFKVHFTEHDEVRISERLISCPGELWEAVFYRVRLHESKERPRPKRGLYAEVIKLAEKQRDDKATGN